MKTHIKRPKNRGDFTAFLSRERLNRVREIENVFYSRVAVSIITSNF